MGRFASANEDKKKIEELILSNDNLLKYLVYTDKNPLENNSIEQTVDLLSSHVFFRPKVPSVNDTAQTMLVIHLTNFKLGNNNTKFKTGKVIFDIIIHNSLWDLDRGDLRAICILDELDNIFNGTRDLGIGKAKFDFSNEMIWNDNFSGYRYVVEFTDFN